MRQFGVWPTRRRFARALRRNNLSAVIRCRKNLIKWRAKVHWSLNGGFEIAELNVLTIVEPFWRLFKRVIVKILHLDVYTYTRVYWKANELIFKRVFAPGARVNQRCRVLRFDVKKRRWWTRTYTGWRIYEYKKINFLFIRLSRPYNEGALFGRLNTLCRIIIRRTRGTWDIFV